MQVPRAPRDTVLPNTPAQPRATADAFGAPQARAMARNSQSLAQAAAAAGQLSEEFERQRQEDLRAEAAGHVMSFQEELLNLQIGYGELVGEDAVSGRRSHADAMQQLQRQYRGKFAHLPGNMRRALDLELRGHLMRARAESTGHYFKQRDFHHSKLAQAQIGTASRVYSHNPDAPGAPGLYMRDTRAAIASELNREGLSEGEPGYSEAMTQRLSAALKGTIAARIDGDAESAEAMLDRHREELTEADANALREAIAQAKVRQKNRAIAAAEESLLGVLDPSEAASKLGLGQTYPNTGPPGAGTRAVLRPTAGISPNMRTAFDFMRDRFPKLPPAVIAGVLGGLRGESGTRLDAEALNPDSHAVGIAQWLGSRKDALFDYAREQGLNPRVSGGRFLGVPLEVQLEFLAKELDGPESSSLRALERAENSGQAADIWTRQFERPSAQEIRDSMEVRIGYASEVEAAITGGVSSHPARAQGAPMDPAIARLSPAERTQVLNDWATSREKLMKEAVTQAGEQWLLEIERGTPGFRTAADIEALTVDGSTPLEAMPGGAAMKTRMLKAVDNAGSKQRAGSELLTLHNTTGVSVSEHKKLLNDAYEAEVEGYAQNVQLAQEIRTAANNVAPHHPVNALADASTDRVGALYRWVATAPPGMPIPENGLSDLEEAMQNAGSAAERARHLQMAAELARSGNYDASLASGVGKRVAEKGLEYAAILHDGGTPAQAIEYLFPDPERAQTRMSQEEVGVAWKAYQDDSYNAESIVQGVVDTQVSRSLIAGIGSELLENLDVETDAVAAELLGTYEANWRRAMEITRNPNIAHSIARAQTSREFGVSTAVVKEDIIGRTEARLMRHPPEYDYSIGGDNSWMADSMLEAVQEYDSNYVDGEIWAEVLETYQDEDGSEKRSYQIFYEAEGPNGEPMIKTIEKHEPGLEGGVPVGFDWNEEGEAEKTRRKSYGGLAESDRRDARELAQVLYRQQGRDKPSMTPADVEALVPDLLRNPQFRELIDAEMEILRRKDRKAVDDANLEEFRRRDQEMAERMEMDAAMAVSGAFEADRIREENGLVIVTAAPGLLGVGREERVYTREGWSRAVREARQRAANELEQQALSKEERRQMERQREEGRAWVEERLNGLSSR